MSTNLGTATYTIRAVEDSSGLRRFRQEQEKTTASMYIMRRAMSVATGMIVADVLRMASTIINENVAIAASYRQLELSFNNLSETGSVSLKELQEATYGMVSNVDLLKSANEALLRGIPTDKLAEMFTIGATLATSKGMTMAEGINAIVDGVGKMREEYLKNIGITMTMSEAYRIYANETHKSVSELTDMEKQQAALNLALIRGRQAMEETDAAIDPLNQKYNEAKTSIENWGVGIGNFLLNAGEPLLDFIIGLNDNLYALSHQEETAFKYYKENPSELVMHYQLLGNSLDEARVKADEYLSKGEELYGETNKLASATYDLNTAFRITTENVDEYIKTMSGIEDTTSAQQALADSLGLIANAYGLVSNSAYLASQGIEDYADAEYRLNQRITETDEAFKDAMEAIEQQAKEASILDELYAELSETTRELSTLETNLGRAIRFASGEIDYYNEAVDTSNWTNQTAVTVYTQLSNSLPSLQRRYDMLGKEVNKYSRQININSNAMSANRDEYDAITQAMKTRQMLAVNQLDEEINKLKLLGAQQGYLTFDQRRRLNTLEEEKRQTEDKVEATTEEEKALARLDKEYSNLVSRNEELNNALDKASRQYDRIGEAISTNTDRMNTLVSVMTEYLRLLQESLSINQEITERGGIVVEDEATVKDTSGGTRAGVALATQTVSVLPNTVSQNTSYATDKSSSTKNNIEVNISVNNGGNSVDDRETARRMIDLFVAELMKRGVKLY